MYIDFHSHFLPQIDDGSRSIEESVKILDKMAENHTDILIATPHFYCSEQSIDSFIKNRDHAYERLRPHIKPTHPGIGFGAEVLFDQALVNHEQLPKLCIKGTDYLLLEMPYTDLTDKIIDGVEAIVNRGDVKVLVAHIERYLNFTSMKSLEKLMRLDVMGQINAVSMTKFKTRKRCLKLIGSGFVHVLGSDFHRIDREHVTVNVGFDEIVKKYDDFKEFAERNGKMLLKNEPIENILTL